MTRIIKTLFVFFIPVLSFAQQDSLWNHFPSFFDHPFRTEKAKPFIVLEGSYSQEASGANNALLWRLGTKQRLGRDLIAQNADRAKLKNLMAFDARGSVSYYNLNKGFMKNDSLHLFFRYGFVDHAGASYSDEFFRLVGQGNKAFEGDTADGNGFVLNRSRFDYFDIGLIRFFPNRSNLAVSLGVTRGMRFADVDGSRLTVYTAEYGTSTFWDIDVNAKLTPGKEQSYFDVHGFGLQLNLEYKGLLGPDGAYAVGARNLGFVSWSGKEYIKKDTFTYNGFYAPDFASFNGSGNSFDSMANEFRPDSMTLKSAILLPAYVYAEYTMKLYGKQSLTFRFDKILNTPMVPRVSVSYTYFCGNWYGITRVSTGGYSRFNLSQELAYTKGKHFVKAMFYGIQAWAFPKKAAGLGGGIGYALSF